MRNAEGSVTPRRSERLRKIREAQTDTRADAEAKVTLKGSSTEKIAPTKKRKASISNVESPLRKKTRTTSNNDRAGSPKQKPKSQAKGLTISQPDPPAPSLLFARKTRRTGPEVKREKSRIVKEALVHIVDDVACYSDPANFLSLPFPSLLDPRSDSFRVKRENNIPSFRFMGRTHVSNIHAHYKAYTDDAVGSRRLILYGARGSGKKLCATALACLLMRLGRRVVYIPHCQILSADFVGIMRDILYLALPSDLYSAVDSAKTPEDIIELVNDFKEDDLVFILPEWDIFLKTPKIDPNVIAAEDWTLRMIRKHYNICTISASTENLNYLNSLGSSVDVYSFVGGLDEREMDFWWRHYSDNLPIGLSKNEKANIEYFTGRMPHILRGLLNFAGRQYSEIKRDYMRNDFYYKIRYTTVYNISTKIQEYSDDEDKMRIIVLFDHMRACIQETSLPSSSTASIQDNNYDRRYFYYTEDNVGHCLSGDIRDIALSELRRRIPSDLDEVSWILAATKVANPLLRKFLLTRICLHRIASRGLQCLDSNLTPMAYIDYDQKPPWEEAIVLKGSTVQYLFIPAQICDALVDGIIFNWDRKKRSLELIPIQVASTSETACTDEYFYLKQWKEMEQGLARFVSMKTITLRSTFVFLVCGRVQEKPTRESRNVSGDGWGLEYDRCDLGLSLLGADLACFI